ncbi:phage antirepressor N-terminal domain-containing protein [Mycolicibacterium neoaurum]|uniref:phage antirepressor N-terminal domain-containing protein n=1 Tax=Mycolicibacterium neoaurum TaxID=1795 RepID=UPI0026729E60|nr:phage antirepressor N-terminal domain-containing protein [Mycolicibacterium neoaurum]MDO3401928.1 phage antirepressor N-terminal domain-containing protein [Mycolicibacterium neoaurum]
MTTDLVTIPVPGTNRKIAATVIDGVPFVSLRHACEAIGLAVESQRKKLASRSWATATQWVSVAEDGRRREMTMVDRRTFTMWLGGIDENRLSSGAKPILVAFQAEAADALDAYFNEGDAINPRADEDQLDRLARQARARAAVLQALMGVVDPKHLEAKGRILLARALGEAPEIDSDDLPLYVHDYLRGKGLTRELVEAKASGFGKRLKALYTVERDRAPQMHPQTLSGGRVVQVCSYTEADRPLFDSVWARHYANVVAESALTVLPGGAG